MTYSMKARREQARRNALKEHNFKRVITKVLRELNIEESFDTYCYLAIADTLLNGGKWNDDRIALVLDRHDDKIKKSLTLTKGILKDAGIIRTQKDKKGQWYTALTPEFSKVAGTEIGEVLHDLPANMLPLEHPPMWKSGDKNDLNIPLISRVHPDVLRRVPQSALDAANKLQQVQFTVNPALVKVLKYRKAELANRGTENQETLVLESQIKHLTNLSEEQKAISFLITYDFRGRAYYRGGILTPQGHDFQKAAFQFAHSRKLGRMGLAALAIHYANVADMDKKSTEEKLDWAMDEGTELADRIANGYFPKSKSKKYQLIVAALEWHRLQKHLAKGKKASKFRSRLVCHMDGTCNGLQHGAALRGCRDTAEATNCVRSTYEYTPCDIYQEGVDILVDKLLEAGHGTQAQLVREKGRICMKYTVMVTGYGAGIKRATATCLSEFSEDHQKILNQVDMEEYVEIALNEIAGALIDTHKILTQAIEAKMDKEVAPIGWHTQDGFLVFQAARASDEEGKEYKGAGDYTYRVDEISKQKQISSITANFIHSMDGNHMRNVVRAFDYDLVTVHDSFGCHAGTYEELSKVVREQFITTHSYNQLASLNKLNDMSLQMSKLGDYEVSEVLESEYFFS